MHELTDTNQTGLPGVVVQERFPTSELGSGMVNDKDHFWTSQKAIAAQPAPWNFWGHWGWDNLVLMATGAWEYPGNVAPLDESTHYYYAASRRTQQILGGVTIEPEEIWGIKVATYLDRFWTNRVEHIKQGS
jgi:hypothetical protein